MEEIRHHSVLYALALFPAIAAFLGGGMAAAGLTDGQKQRIIAYFFHGGGYWQVVGNLMIKRFVCFGIQAFFCIWMMGLPVSVFGGMGAQISWSLPWVSMFRSAGQGFLLTAATLPVSMVHLLAGGYCFSVSLRYFRTLMGSIALRKSSVDILREGWIPMRKILLAGMAAMVCVPAEVAVYMNMV